MKYYQLSALDIVFKITLFILVFFCFQAVSVSAQSYDEHTARAKYAGLYVSVSFGQRTTEQSKVKFGFTAGLRQDQFSGRFNLTGRKVFQGRLLDLQFNQKGFRKLSFAGTNLMHKDASGGLVYLDGEGGDGMSLGGKILIGTGIVVVVAAGAFYFIVKGACERDMDCHPDYV